MIQYIENYPRPQFVRKEWKNLNGKWKFLFDDENIGERNGYYNCFPTSSIINVPFSYECKQSGMNNQEIHNIVWYNRKIDMTEFDNQGRKVILHFEGSDYLTKVWINGKYVGINEGGYTRFSFEIDQYLIKGMNDITVRVEDSLSKSQPRGKQRYKKDSWECWYVETTGIWKTVWLEFVANEYINCVKNTPNYDDKKIELVVETNISEKSYDVNDYEFKAIISFGNQVIANNTVKLTENSQKLEIDLDDQEIYYWDTQTPNLYNIEYELYKNGNLIDEVYSYFGIRKISVIGNKIFLNEKELYQKLILDQGYWGQSLTPPDESAIVKDIDFVLKFGFNGIRKHQKIEDERFLYWCDVKGVLVWSEMPSFYEYNDKSIEQFTKEWIKAIKQNYNHPCIITWVPINESWGVKEVKNNIAQQNFINSLYYLTKSIDQTRLVITNDGWEHTISDVITIHDYKQDSKELEDLYITNKNKILEENEPFKINHSIFASNYKYNRQPIIMSEYGGIALHSNDGWGYGKKVENENEFIERFENLTKMLKSIPYLSGYCYTQLTDVQQEINGLIDENRNTKFSEEINKKINDINN